MSTPLPEALSTDPADILMPLIIACLAPMFLGVTGGDIVLARDAALATVNGYRARGQTDLIVIAQIVAFGLAALGSLGLAMADDTPVTLALRLQSNAVALTRAADQNRRALTRQPQQTRQPKQAQQPARTPPADTPIHDFEIDEAAIIASVAKAQKAAAEALVRLGLIPAPATSETAIQPSQTAQSAVQPAQRRPTGQQF